MTSAPIVLLVEDNDDHAELVVRRLREHKIESQVVRVADGESALEYLQAHRAGEVEETGPVHLVLVDLRLPKIDGLEVLRTIRSDDSLRRIPVVVLTTSADREDVVRAQELHANAYVVKPVDFDNLGQLVRDLGSFWLAWNEPPRE